MSSKEDPRPRSPSRPAWSGPWRAVAIPSLMSSFTIILLVLGIMAYLYGIAFEQRSRTHALNILVVDFDGGEIGAAVTGATQNFQGSQYPTINVGSPDDFRDPSAVRGAVCRANYWAAVYVHEGASTRLTDALNGTAAEYDAADTVSYIYNQARYPTVADSTLLQNLQALIQASPSAYQQSPSGREALASLNTSEPVSVQAYLNPITASSDLIQPTTQGGRNFYNTLNNVLALLSQFFLILALNGIGSGAGLFAQSRMRDVWLFRFTLGKIFGLLCSLAMTGCMWAFREDWEVSAGNFAESWMVLWFAMDINWQVMDTLIGAYLPMQFLPFFVLPWMIMNTASTMFPLEIMPGFYRIGYAFPMHEAYTLLVRAWSGCGNELEVALPVLFAWWLVGHITAVFATRKRSIDAAKMAGAMSRTQNEEQG